MMFYKHWLSMISCLPINPTSQTQPSFPNNHENNFCFKNRWAIIFVKIILISFLSLYDFYDTVKLVKVDSFKKQIVPDILYSGNTGLHSTFILLRFCQCISE